MPCGQWPFNLIISHNINIFRCEIHYKYRDGHGAEEWYHDGHGAEEWCLACSRKQR
jgi:hypothetical protein